MSSLSLINEDLCSLEVDYFLKKALSKTREVPAGSVLQIHQISNISVPKQDGQQNYEGERHVLKIVLTDGDSTIFSLVSEPLPRINMNTPPGAKIKITQAVPVNGQIFVLTKNNHQFLGGDVPKLIEKWNFQRKMDIKQEWGATGNIGGSDGPPIWRPFGQKAANLDIALLRKAKAMDIINEKKESAKEGDGSQTQFDLQRNEAISELMEKNVKQKFQKPNKHLLDREIVIIMEEGFSIDEATDALKRFKNPQKALKFLKTRNGELPVEEKSSVGGEERKERKKRPPKDLDQEEDHVPVPKEYQRPTRNISLFGFIAEHIKSDDNTAESDDKKINEVSDSFENMDFRDRDSRGRGGRGYRSRGGSIRGNDGYRRGGYNRNDSDNGKQFDSQPSYPSSDKGAGFRGRGTSYSDSRGDRGRQDYQRGRDRQDPVRDHSQKDYHNDRETSAYTRDQGRQESNRGHGNHDYNRGERRSDFNRDQGRQEFSRDQERQDYSRDQERPNYNRGQGRQDYSRGQGRSDYNSGGGRQEFNRNQGQQEYSSGGGRQDYNSRDHQDHQKYNYPGQTYDDRSNTARHENNYPSLSQNQPVLETDVHKTYSQAPRFQKQYSSSGENSSVPYGSGSGGHRDSNRIPSSHSFPQPDNYQHPSRDFDYNSGPRSQANGFRIAPPEHDQNRYGNSDSWSPNQTMVFTRSRPGGGGSSGGRSSRGGRGFPASSRY